ncbi:conserved Plasmodium protein, unknown function [Plasmodium gaboni]|uniref:RTR1-type domain-containing protein n=1 Tax=Plasmodium gaboni TaxID=647221 RepID=A0ABY1UHP7_9APIC|nr:conserved Plasmodium protein, unknown function [Plasmodium gaboni]
MSEESEKILYEKEKKIQALSKIYHIKLETLLIYIIIPKTTKKSLCYNDFFDNINEIKNYINIEEEDDDENNNINLKVNEEVQQRKTKDDDLKDVNQKKDENGKCVENDGDNINGDNIYGDNINGDNINGDNINGDNINSDNINGDNINGDNINGDNIYGDNINGVCDNVSNINIISNNSFEKEKKNIEYQEIPGDKNLFIKNLLVFINNILILYFSKCDLIDICINRRSYNKCGFYACDNIFLNNINNSKYKIDTKNKKIYLREYYDLFCSTNCMNFNLGLLKHIIQNNKNSKEEINYKKKAQLIHIMFLTFFPFFKLYNLTYLINNINKYRIESNKIYKIKTNINNESVYIQQTDNNIIKMNETNKIKEKKKKKNKIYNHATNIKIKENFHHKKQVFIEENNKDTCYIVKKKDKCKYILINNKDKNMKHKKSILKNIKDNQENTQKTNQKNVCFNGNIKLYQYNKDDNINSYSIHDSSVELKKTHDKKKKKKFKETGKKKKKKYHGANKFNSLDTDHYNYTSDDLKYKLIKELDDTLEHYISKDNKYEKHNIEKEDKLINNSNTTNNNKESILNKSDQDVNVSSLNEHTEKEQEKNVTKIIEEIKIEQKESKKEIQQNKDNELKEKNNGNMETKLNLYQKYSLYNLYELSKLDESKMVEFLYDNQKENFINFASQKMNEINKKHNHAEKGKRIRLLNNSNDYKIKGSQIEDKRNDEINTSDDNHTNEDTSCVHFKDEITINEEEYEKTKEADHYINEKTKEADHYINEKTKEADHYINEKTKEADHYINEKTKEADHYINEKTKEADHYINEKTKETDHCINEKTKEADHYINEKTKETDHCINEKTKEADHYINEETKEADHYINEETDDIKLQALLMEKKEKIREEYIQTFKSDMSLNIKLYDNDKHEYEHFNELEDDVSTYDDLSYDHFMDEESEYKKHISNKIIKMNENKYIYSTNNGHLYENLSLYVVLWDIFTNTNSKYTVHFFKKNELIIPKGIIEEERKRRNEFIHNISQNMPTYINCISSIIVNICRTFLFHKPLIPFKKVIYKSINCVIAVAIKLYKPDLIPSSEMPNIKKAEDYLIFENKIDQEELNDLCMLFFQNNFY